jgi:hypothetical protein
MANGLQEKAMMVKVAVQLVISKLNLSKLDKEFHDGGKSYLLD